MKLKTLKDFEFRLFTKEGTNKFANKNIKNDLKQEAIKWVKWMKKDNNKTAMKREGFFKEFLAKDELAFLFIKFFNISEEDLKGGVDDGKRN